MIIELQNSKKLWLVDRRNSLSQKFASLVFLLPCRVSVLLPFICEFPLSSAAVANRVYYIFSNLGGLYFICFFKPGIGKVVGEDRVRIRMTVFRTEIIVFPFCNVSEQDQPTFKASLCASLSGRRLSMANGAGPFVLRVRHASYSYCVCLAMKQWRRRVNSAGSLLNCVLVSFEGCAISLGEKA